MKIDEVELRIIRAAVPQRRSRTSFGAETREARDHRHRPLRRGGGLRRGRDGPAARVPRGDASPVRCTCCATRSCPTCWRSGCEHPSRAHRSVGAVAWQPDGQDRAGAGRVGLLRPPAGRAAAHAARRRAHRDPGRRQPRHEPASPRRWRASRQHVEQGYQRVKLKIEPGWDVELLAAVRAEFPVHRAHRRRQLGVHAGRRCRCCARSTSSACTTSSSRCTGTTSPTTPCWRASCARALCLDEIAHVAGAREGRARPRRVHRRQRQGRPRRRPAVRARDPRPVRRAGRADVVRRHVGDRHRPRPQHPPRHDARLRVSRATPRRPAAPTPATSPSNALEAVDGVMPVPAGPGHRCDAGPAVPRRGDGVGRKWCGDARASACSPTADELAVMPGVRGLHLGRRRRSRVGERARRRDHRGRRRHRRVRRRAARRRRCSASPRTTPGVLHSHYLAVHPDLPRLGPRRADQARPGGVVPATTATTRCAGRSTRCSSPMPTSTSTSSARSACSYHVNHYGALGGINGSLPSDRLTVQWELVAPRPAFARVVRAVGAAGDARSRSPRRRTRGVRGPPRHPRRDGPAPRRRLGGHRRRPPRPHLHPAR